MISHEREIYFILVRNIWCDWFEGFSG